MTKVVVLYVVLLALLDTTALTKSKKSKNVVNNSINHIIHLHPKVTYVIRVTVEKLTYPGRIIPVITVPGGKGKIVANTLLADYNGNVSSKKLLRC